MSNDALQHILSNSTEIKAHIPASTRRNNSSLVTASAFIVAIAGAIIAKPVETAIPTDNSDLIPSFYEDTPNELKAFVVVDYGFKNDDPLYNPISVTELPDITPYKQPSTVSKSSVGAFSLNKVLLPVALADEIENLLDSGIVSENLSETFEQRTKSKYRATLISYVVASELSRIDPAQSKISEHHKRKVVDLVISNHYDHAVADSPEFARSPEYRRLEEMLRNKTVTTIENTVRDVRKNLSFNLISNLQGNLYSIEELESTHFLNSKIKHLLDNEFPEIESVSVNEYQLENYRAQIVDIIHDYLFDYSDRARVRQLTLVENISNDLLLSKEEIVKLDLDLSKLIGLKCKQASFGDFKSKEVYAISSFNTDDVLEYLQSI